MLFIGTAGWAIRKQQQEVFPLAGTHLERYAQVFNSVEINSSFYRDHQPKTYARWAATVPHGFKFSVKLPRAITHEHRLAGVHMRLRGFLGQVSELGEKLGVLLIQLPPSLVFGPLEVNAFFEVFRSLFAGEIALEARHPSWFAHDATALLGAFAITRVVADPAVVSVPEIPPQTSGYYLRLHGSPEIYTSAYSSAQIVDFSRKLRQAEERDETVWCIFDNTARGNAVPNALEMLELNPLQAGLFRAPPLRPASSNSVEMGHGG